MEWKWIVITAAPRRFGPQQWPFDDLMGVVTPVLRVVEVRQLPAGSWLALEQDEQGHVVSISDVVVSLEDLGRDRAVGFWRAVIDAGQWRYLCFERSICELVDAPSLGQPLQAR